MTGALRPQEGRRLFGRRRGHKLRVGRARLMKETAPELAIPELKRCEDNATETISVDPNALFSNVSDIWLEIGFGGGEHLTALAKAHPEIGFIGCEHFIDGVAKMVSAVVENDLNNVRVHAHDARDVMDALPDNSVGRIYLLYPDPWPKKRHHRRRFFNRETLDAAARLLRPGGEYRIASDIPDYIRHCLQIYLQRRSEHLRDIEWTAERASDWREPWADWPGTRYERKALAAGRAPLYVTFRKL